MKILELDIICPEVRTKLVLAGIETLSALADLHTSPRRCLELSHETGLQIGEIRKIISAALFCQIGDVGIEHSGLLVKVGIDSVGKLANSNEEKIFQEMTQCDQLNGQKNNIPSLEMLRGWITRSRELVHLETENYEA